MRPTSSAEDGFTLVEVLLAGAVLAMVAALLLPVVRIASQVETRTREQAELREGHARLERLMRETFWQAQAAPDSLNPQRLTGAPGSVSFLTRPAGQAGLYQASLEIEGEGVLVTLAQWPDGPRFQSQFGLQADDLRFYFYGRAEDGSAPAWSEDWTHPWMPRLVVLDMTRHDGQVRRIEALVGGRAPVDCEYDSGQGICLGADY